MEKLAVLAFGGNALLRSGQKGTFEEQLRNVEATCENLVPLLKQGYGIIIGHGNGPQVGNGLLRHQAGEQAFGLPAQPMDFCGAETQGSIAYLIETGLDRVMARHGISRKVLSLVTRVEVRADDPMFRNPTKPVGPYYAQKPEDGCVYKEDPKGRGWRKVVASPVPVGIENVDLVGRLAAEGYIVVTVGGGGIPVVREGGVLRGVEAVIDKDLASALCAVKTGAQEFYILTDGSGEGIPPGRPVCRGLHGPQGAGRHLLYRERRKNVHHNRSGRALEPLLRNQNHSITQWLIT